MKFLKDGQFIKTWGHKGAAPGDFDEPHDIFIGGSQQRVYVADRQNKRIQVFDQDGNFLAAWTQFGVPSSVFVGKDDTIYVGASFPDPTAKKGEPWIAVTTAAVEPVPNPVTLAAIKAEPKLKDMALVKYGRLSVQPVTDEQWKLVCKMGGLKKV